MQACLTQLDLLLCGPQRRALAPGVCICVAMATGVRAR